MKNQTLKILLLSLCLSIGITCSINGQSLPKEEHIEAIFKALKHQDQPGASVAIIKDGKVIYKKGFGSANLEYNIPITETTVFHAASLSKQFTVFAILLLEKDGKLSLDDDIRQYISEVPDFGKKITLRHLANHTSGLRDQWRLLQLAGWRLDDVITKAHIFKLIKKQKALNFNPGEENLYSNTGFTLLAEVVARVSGKTFAEFTKERIFIPLNMMHTQFYDDHQKIVKNRAYSYTKDDNDIIKKKTLSYANVGATSLFTTAEDFSKWALNFENPIVGNKEIIAAMNTKTTLPSGNKTGYALGQFIGTYQGINVIVHSGSDAGYKAYFCRVPDHNLSVIVLANMSSIQPINYVLEILDLYLKDFYPKEDAFSKKPNYKPDPSTFIVLTHDELQKFTGKYWEPKEQYTRELIVENDTLVYNRPEGNKTKLIPVGKNKFKMLGDSENVSVIFNTNAFGEKRAQIIINDKDPLDLLAYTDVNLNDYTGSFYSEELSSSYDFNIKNNSLIAEHSRHPDIKFKPIKTNVFISDNRNYANIKFKRSKDGKVIGLYITNDRARNLWFQKR